MDRYTYYPSPLLVFGSSGYSKHYFIEGQRVMSRIGDIWDAEAALIPLDTTPDGVDLNNKADQIEAQLETHLACLALAGEVDYHVDLEWLGWETEPIVFFYHPDHLGSSSFITGATGEPTQHLEYLPFGELFIEERSTWNTPYKFSGKELDDETGYSYFGARYYDPNISIWLSVDPLSDKYPHQTPYSYVGGNPLMMIDPNGMEQDWVESADGKIYWDDNATSQETTKEGETYLGKAVVVMDGSAGENLGKDGTLTGEGANPAKVTIYGPGGADDIQTYDGLTMTSNPDYFTPIASGDYEGYYEPMSSSPYGDRLTYRVRQLDGNLLLPTLNGELNKDPNAKGTYGTPFKSEIFFHRTNNSGYAGARDQANAVSKGCPVVCAKQWQGVENQLGKIPSFRLRIIR